MSRAKTIPIAMLAALGVLAACNPAPSAPGAVAEATAPAIGIVDPWAAATPNGVTVAAGYLTIVNNTDEADALIAVSSPRAPRVEVHEMAMEGDVMRMRAAGRLEAPAHGSITLAPGSYHLMFMDIATPFVAGESVPVTFTFEHAGAVTTELPVRDRQGDEAAMSHDH